MNRKRGSILKSLHVTEKTGVLESLAELESNLSVKRCKQAKVVFLVDVRANKHEIRKEIEEVYKDQKIKVSKVNTILQKGKTKRVRGRQGKKGCTARVKKAIITLSEGSKIDFGS